MRGFIFYGWLLVSVLCSTMVHAQQIQGEVTRLQNNTAIEGVSIENIYTGISVNTNASGAFKIAASKGHLLEFRKIGYKTIRLRIPEGVLPPFFKITMEEGPIELPEFLVQRAPANYHDDSVKYYELYKHQLEFPKLKGYQAIQHPFSALSKKNRQIWAFQEHYEWFQQEKYIDYNFNERIVGRITGLAGDSVQAYMQLFRPAYEQLRSMDEYSYYNYIKRTVELYRERGIRARMSPVRSTG